MYSTSQKIINIIQIFLTKFCNLERNLLYSYIDIFYNQKISLLALYGWQIYRKLGMSSIFSEVNVKANFNNIMYEILLRWWLVYFNHI